MQLAVKENLISDVNRLQARPRVFRQLQVMLLGPDELSPHNPSLATDFTRLKALARLDLA